MGLRPISQSHPWVSYQKAAIFIGVSAATFAISGLALAVLFNPAIAQSLRATLFHQTLLGRCVAYGSLGVGSALAIIGIGIGVKTRHNQSSMQPLASLTPPGVIQRNKQALSNEKEVQKRFEELKREFHQKISRLDKSSIPADVNFVIEKLRETTVDLEQTCAGDPKILGDVYSSACAELDELIAIARALGGPASQQTEMKERLRKKANTQEIFSYIRSEDSARLERLLTPDNVNDSIEGYTQGTVLHAIAKKGSGKLVELLARKGANFNLQDNWGNTPLLWAIANAQNESALEIIRIGRHHGLNPNIQDNIHANTALHLAVGKGYRNLNGDGAPLKVSNVHILNALLEVKAGTNLQNGDGNTPLHLAYVRRDHEMIAILQWHGADERMPNHRGLLPSQMAQLSYDEASSILRATVSVFRLDRDRWL